MSSLSTSCKCNQMNLASCLPRPVNVVALCWKNLMRIYRNPGLLIFQFFIPAFQIVIFSLAIGRNLTGIKVTYTNDDSSTYPLSLVCTNTDIDNGFTNISNLGELYVRKLVQDGRFDMVSICSLHHWGMEISIVGPLYSGHHWGTKISIVGPLYSGHHWGTKIPIAGPLYSGHH